MRAPHACSRASTWRHSARSSVRRSRSSYSRSTDLDGLLPAVEALGRRHAAYGIADHHFDSVGAALVRAFSETLGDAWTPAVQDAWVAAYGLIVSVMRRTMQSAPQSLLHT